MSKSTLARPLLQFHFDITSPYSYLGFEVIQRYRKVGGGDNGGWSKQHLDVEYVPIFLGGIMKVLYFYSALGDNPVIRLSHCTTTTTTTTTSHDAYHYAGVLDSNATH